MKISAIPGLGRFGVYIDDVDLATISNEEWMEIGKIHLEKLVTIIRNSNCNKDRQTELMVRFGDTRNGMKSSMMKRYGNINFDKLMALAESKSPLISEYDRTALLTANATQVSTKNGKDVNKIAGGDFNDGTPKGLFSEGELLWHSNESGTLTFTPGVALLGKSNTIGSATGFMTTPDYYENVSNSFRSELDEMIITHRFTPGKINPGLNDIQDSALRFNMCPEDDTDIPLVIQSPGGIKGLHYSVNTVYSIVGMTKLESQSVFKEIEKELFVDKYIYDHWYKSNNDLCLFDNTITLHRRLGNIDGRLAYRLASDYTNLQDGVYQPYFQKKYQKAYNTQIRNDIKLLGINNFKLPKKTLSDYIPFIG